jgi:hypothetical protein
MTDPTENAPRQYKSHPQVVAVAPPPTIISISKWETASPTTPAQPASINVILKVLTGVAVALGGIVYYL